MEEKDYCKAIQVIIEDKRINVWHISLYHALWQLWRLNNFKSPVHISRKKIMDIIPIRSIATYHKYISQLERFGYIRYVPSYHPSFGSEVYLLTVGNDKNLVV